MRRQSLWSLFPNLKLSLVLLIVTGVLSACTGQHVQSAKGDDMSALTSQGTVIEIATFKLRPGVTADEFRPLDKAVELEHVVKQPGFISRESAAGENSEWLVIVHWRSVADAEASMASFATAPATAAFMSTMDANTFIMKRYRRQ